MSDSKVNSNYHTHSRFCDGHEEPADYVAAALKKGFQYLGFSGHAPISLSNDWLMPESDYPEYERTIRELQKRHIDRIQILHGLEVDYVPGVSSPHAQAIKQLGLDFTIGSVHFLGYLKNGTAWTVDGPVDELAQGIADSFDGDPQRAVEEYYYLLKTLILDTPPDIIGHFDIIKKNNADSRFFSEDAPWYRSCVFDVLDVLARSPCVLEISTGGINRGICADWYPSRWILDRCLELDIPITICSDAHRPEQLDGHFAETVVLLRQIGYTRYKQLTLEGWITTDLP